MGSQAYIVLKFGGTSVSTARGWQTALGQARMRIDQGLRPVLVASALAQTTDTLVRMLGAAASGQRSFRDDLQTLRARHVELAAALGVDAEEALAPELAELERLLTGLDLVRDRTPRLEARVLGMGEVLSTKLGAQFLSKEGLATEWVDSRQCLVAAPGDERPEAARVLSAVVDDAADPALRARFDGIFERAACVLAPGFIASDASGGPVLLGRGGSDTSAAYFAAKLGAARCEIWTDVAGIFTADPRLVPSARLVRRATYDESQEIASTGAKVLHPRAIAPCRRHRIPIEIRWTEHPDAAHTLIDAGDETGSGLVKAISLKRGVTLVSMETNGMWQAVGFLADVFACFRAHGVSVDLVSTSEMNVTVTLDATANTLDPKVLDALASDLSRFCRPRITGGCAAISLVGRRIRALLHRLGPVLEVFEEHRVHLVTQAASDLNLAFVVDEEHAERLVRDLHALAFGAIPEQDDTFGPPSRVLEAGRTSIPARVDPHPWWRSARERLLELAARETPLYVYDRSTIDETLRSLCALRSVARVFYALKANPHAVVLEAVDRAGAGFECVSPGELARVHEVCPHVAPDRILFTPNFVAKDELVRAFALGCHVTVDNARMLELWPDVFQGRSIMLRVDPGHGRGHHAYVHTAGTSSKFGIPQAELPEAAELARRASVRVVGLHAHVGSGILDPASWPEVANALREARALFPDATVLDIGGGLGVPERPGQAPLDLAALDAALASTLAASPGISFWLEPGRYVVARAGVLLARVTQLKRKGEQQFVGVDVGMNGLIRPALYGAYHEILNLTRLDEPSQMTASVVGPICESGDVLGHSRRLPKTREGDVLLIATVGAYGHSMASTYNLRPPPRELVLP